eukprot:g33887.t1
MHVDKQLQYNYCFLSLCCNEDICTLHFVSHKERYGTCFDDVYALVLIRPNQANALAHKFVTSRFKGSFKHGRHGSFKHGRHGSHGRRHVVVVQEPRRHHGTGEAVAAGVVGAAVGGGLGYMAGKKHATHSTCSSKSTATYSVASPTAPVTFPQPGEMYTVNEVRPANQPSNTYHQVYQPPYAGYGGVQSLENEDSAGYGGQQILQPGSRVSDFNLPVTQWRDSLLASVAATERWEARTVTVGVTKSDRGADQ